MINIILILSLLLVLSHNDIIKLLKNKLLKNKKTIVNFHTFEFLIYVFMYFYLAFISIY